jgi:predicted Rossmann fold flavoprotein
MTKRRVAIVGGGAAGFFAAITCAEAAPGVPIVVLEKSHQFLSKVRISGGGRCNVTHACFDPRELANRYPRGGKALISPFQKFQPRDTIDWFERRGVRLKTEPDGRMFPTTDSSETIVNCLTEAARAAGVSLWSKKGVESLARREGGGFLITLEGGETLEADCVLLATGGARTESGGSLASSLGHTLETPVPSLFTFEVEVPWVRQLAGVALPDVEVTVPEIKLKERGPVLLTHWGLSGPGVLRLSAWGARSLFDLGYRFTVHLNWFPGQSEESVSNALLACAEEHPSKLIINTPRSPVPGRLWTQLVMASGLRRDIRWNQLTRAQRHVLAQHLTRTVLPVTGKSMNKEEFVTCGGVSLKEIDFKTMQSRLCPGLYIAGELLDIDAITGGFNFQAAWTTGWIAGNAMAEAVG